MLTVGTLYIAMAKSPKAQPAGACLKAQTKNSPANQERVEKTAQSVWSILRMRSLGGSREEVSSDGSISRSCAPIGAGRRRRLLLNPFPGRRLLWRCSGCCLWITGGVEEVDWPRAVGLTHGAVPGPGAAWLLDLAGYFNGSKRLANLLASELPEECETC
jgi:hypothetical protein